MTINYLSYMTSYDSMIAQTGRQGWIVWNIRSNVQCSGGGM